MSIVILNDLDHKTMENKLKDIGMFEPGMSIDDMVRVLEVVKESEKTASDEHEYQSIMSQTDKNCEQLSKMFTESDSSFFSDDNSSPTENEEFEVTVKDEPIVDEAVAEAMAAEPCKHIDVFCASAAGHEPLVTLRPNANAVSPIYCQLRSLGKPRSAAKLIYEYHVRRVRQLMAEQRKSIHTVPWTAPVTDPALVQSPARSPDERPQGKRRASGTADGPDATPSKRRRGSSPRSSPDPEVNGKSPDSDSDDIFSMSHTTLDSGSEGGQTGVQPAELVAKRPSLFKNCEEYFDEVKKLKTEKQRRQAAGAPAQGPPAGAPAASRSVGVQSGELEELEQLLRSPGPAPSDAPSSDDEIFPEIRTVAVIHNEKTPVKGAAPAGAGPARRGRAPPRDRRKGAAVEGAIESGVDCPICGKAFAMSVIEKHASECLARQEALAELCPSQTQSARPARH